MLDSVLFRAATGKRSRWVTRALPARRLARRFVAGETASEAVAAADELTGQGLSVTFVSLSGDALDEASAAAARDVHLELLRALAPLGLGSRADLTLPLPTLGQRLPEEGAKIALEHARAVCAAAAEAGVTVTLAAPDADTADATLATLATLRADHPSTGVTLAACLGRTEADARELIGTDSRARLTKGSDGDVTGEEVDRAYARVLSTLMGGRGYPMIATHDRRILDIAGHLATITHGRPNDTFELQLGYGALPKTQRRLADEGENVRVCVPFGPYDRTATLDLLARSR
ncbi:MAG: proline dehydrogenase [Streptosporangiales bacterium]|nr:proline dehydrogenase [Streptosporangiales bacterium]